VFLERIVASTRSRIARLREERSNDSLLADAKEFTRRSFQAAISSSAPAVIAEIKKASPSKGILRADFDATSLALSYKSGGAAAYSVVTEPEFFQGDGAWIVDIRSTSTLPILRKDFVLEPIQVAEAAALGADAILLVARLLSVEQMRELYDAARTPALDVLFEAHDEGDLEKIGQCGPLIVGINARNLDTFVVDTAQFEVLRNYLPRDVTAVAESGIESHDQIVSAMKLGYSAFLIGESLVKSDDSAAALRLLRTGAPS
jgi:indole-3-glycerol phosphate synthase